MVGTAIHRFNTIAPVQSTMIANDSKAYKTRCLRVGRTVKQKKLIVAKTKIMILIYLAPFLVIVTLGALLPFFKKKAKNNATAAKRIEIKNAA